MEREKKKDVLGVGVLMLRPSKHYKIRASGRPDPLYHPFHAHILRTGAKQKATAGGKNNTCLSDQTLFELNV